MAIRWKILLARRSYICMFITSHAYPDLSQNIMCLADQCNVRSVAGSETTATTLSGFTYYICNEPRAYQKLVSEIRNQFSTYESIDATAVGGLPYLNAVIKEALRIFPAVAIDLPRVSPGETVDGFYIPAGTEIGTQSFAATHSKANFHKPDEFIPERWLDPDCKDIKEASQPFSMVCTFSIGRLIDK